MSSYQLFASDDSHDQDHQLTFSLKLRLQQSCFELDLDSHMFEEYSRYCCFDSLYLMFWFYFKLEVIFDHIVIWLLKLLCFWFLLSLRLTFFILDHSFITNHQNLWFSVWVFILNPNSCLQVLQVIDLSFHSTLWFDQVYLLIDWWYLLITLYQPSKYRFPFHIYLSPLQLSWSSHFDSLSSKQPHFKVNFRYSPSCRSQTFKSKYLLVSSLIP